MPKIMKVNFLVGKIMKKLSMSFKIYFVLSLSVLTSVIIGCVGMWALKGVKEKLDYAYEKRAPRLANALKAESNLRRLTIAQYRLIISENDQQRQKISEEIATYKNELDEDFKRGMAMSAEARVPVWKAAESNFKAWWEKSLVIQNLASQQKPKEAIEESKKQRPFRVAAEKGLDELVLANTEGAQKDLMDANADYKQTFLSIVAISAFSIFITALLAWLIMRSLMNSLNQTVSRIQESATQVTTASTQIATASQELADASTEQAAALQETAASLEEITSMISRSTDNAQSSAETSTESHKKAEEGREAVDHMLTSIYEISRSNEAILTQINQSNHEMTDIVKVIQEIGERTKVINEIVFQTKLLSFNASVEAARAGQHGKGFAVVAEEVGKLAQMSGNAAKEITDMLDASISKVEGIVQNTQTKVETLVQNGKEKVDSGVSVAKRCSEVLNEIVQNVSRVAGLSQEISEATKEQSQGVTEINKAMAQLDSVTQQNAATSEEAASAAKELSEQADTLNSTINKLMQVISGSEAAFVPAPKVLPRAEKPQNSFKKAS